MRKPWFIGFVTFNAMLAALIGGAAWSYGSPARALAAWNGQVIQPDRELQVLALGPRDRSGEVSFRIKNLGGDRVRVVGCFIGCIGKMVEGAPFALDPGQEHPIRFYLRCAPGDALDNSTIRIELYTNLAGQQTVPLRVRLKRAGNDS